MTAAGAGHPDWQTYASWRGPVLQDAPISLGPSGSASIASGYIPHYSGLSIKVDTGAGGGILQVNSATSESASNFLTDSQWIIAPDGQLNVTTPVASGYVDVALNASGTLGFDRNVSIVETNVATGKANYFALTTMLQPGPVALAAGTTQQFLFMDLIAGDATLKMAASVSSASVGARVRPIDESGVLGQDLIRLDTSTNTLDRFILPQQSVVLEYFNTSAAAATVNATLIASIG